MPQKFKISPVEKGAFYFITETSNVKEDLFWLILNDKVKLLTLDLPDQFDDALIKVKTSILFRPVTVDNFQFEITSKP